MTLKHDLDVIIDTCKQCASFEEAAKLLDLSPKYLQGLMREHAPASAPKAKIGRKKIITDSAAVIADYKGHGFASWTAKALGVSTQTILNVLKAEAPELLEQRGKLREQVERTYKVSSTRTQGETA